MGTKYLLLNITANNKLFENKDLTSPNPASEYENRLHL